MNSTDVNEPAVCALPGCGAAFSQVPGGPPRRYCGPAHRIAARQLGVQQAVHAAAGLPAAVEAGVAWSGWLTDAATDNQASGRRIAVSRPGWLAVARPGWLADGTPGWLAGRKSIAVAGAIALAAVIVPAELLTGNSPPPAASHPAAAARQNSSQAPSAQLLAKSETWSAQARHELASIDQQLAALQQAQRELEAVPASQRSTRARALALQLKGRITQLERQQSHLITGLAMWLGYQRSAQELARVRVELHDPALHGPGLHAAGSPAAGVSASQARELARSQATLTSQVGVWTALLRDTVAQPVEAVATAPAVHLIAQVRHALPGVMLTAATPQAPDQPVRAQPSALSPPANAAVPPATGVPPVSVPAVSVPPDTIPSVTVPPATQPHALQPPGTQPALTVPPDSVPTSAVVPSKLSVPPDSVPTSAVVPSALTVPPNTVPVHDAAPQALAGVPARALAVAQDVTQSVVGQASNALGAAAASQAPAPVHHTPSDPGQRRPAAGQPGRSSASAAASGSAKQWTRWLKAQGL